MLEAGAPQGAMLGPRARAGPARLPAIGYVVYTRYGRAGPGSRPSSWPSPACRTTPRSRSSDLLLAVVIGIATAIVAAFVHASVAPELSPG